MATTRPKSVIVYMIDGMGWGQLQLLFDAAESRGETTAMGLVSKQGNTAYCGVSPRGALVPESGASASAFATGHKVSNRSLAQLSGGKRLENIFELAKKEGKATGLVTTARLTHASPAAFLVHMPQRDNEYEIAERVVSSGVDILLGGGRRYFPTSLLNRAESEGYRVVRAFERLDAAPGTKLLGLFAERTFPFALDRGRVKEQVPSLEEMTRTAIARLSRDPDGFVLVVDARLIDEASHYHDAAGVLVEMRQADQAVAAGLRFLEDHPDTLLLVVSNHDTGGMGMVYQANPARWGGPTELARIAGQRASLHWILGEIWRKSERGKALDAPLVQGVLRSYFPRDVPIREQDARAVIDALSLGPKRSPFAYSPASHAIAKILEPYYLVAWNTGTHTSSPVPCFGIGPGSEALRGFLENTDVFHIINGR